MKYRMGRNAKMYYSATLLANADAGVATGLAAATLCKGLSEVSITLAKDKAEVTTRGNTGAKSYQGALKDATVSFKINVETAAAEAFQALLEDSYLNDTELALYALNGPKSDPLAKGPAGNWVVFKYDRDESLSDKIAYDVELQPGGTEIFAWATGTA